MHPNSFNRAPIRTGLIGSGIQASRSPAIHMTEATALGMNLRYDLLDLDLQAEGAGALERVLRQAEADGFAGVNITYPCKQRVMPLLHELADDARRLGAVNTVVFTDGKRIGHNTDWYGFAEGFRRSLAPVPMQRVTQLGAGGAGSAVAYAMLRLGVSELQVMDTDPAKAEQLCAALAPHAGATSLKVVTDLAAAVAQSDGLINTTPVGMNKYPGMPLAASMLRPALWVAEIVYFPLETELLRQARALGCRTADGGGMVVFQAAESFRLFTGVTPDAARMLSWFREQVRS